MRTFLLGAGASRAEGIPLTAEIIPLARTLLRAAKELRARYQAGQWVSPDYACAMVTPAEQMGIFDPRYIDAFESVLELASDINKDADIEDIACFLDNEASKKTLMPKWSETDLIANRISLDAVLAFVLHCGRIDARTGEREFHTPYDIYTRWSQIVGEDDAILTLNYDYAVDFALGTHTNHSAPEYSIDYGVRPPIRIADRPPQTHFERSGPPRLLLHLHGSIGWLYCELCNIITSTINPYDFTAGWDLNSSLILPETDQRRDSFSVCACGERTKPLIVSPALHKRYDNPMIDQVWAAAADAIACSRELVCIGCSFRPNDTRLSDLLRFNAQGVSRIVCVTLRSDPLFESRVKDILPTAEIVEGGFQSYLAASA